MSSYMRQIFNDDFYRVSLDAPGTMFVNDFLKHHFLAGNMMHVSLYSEQFCCVV